MKNVLTYYFCNVNILIIFRQSIDKEEYLLFDSAEREWLVKILVTKVRKVAFEL